MERSKRVLSTFFCSYIYSMYVLYIQYVYMCYVYSMYVYMCYIYSMYVCVICTVCMYVRIIQQSIIYTIYLVGLELLPTDQSADITHSAYISIQIPESSQSRIFSSSSSSWKRCYLILRNGSMLYYYSSKQAFSTNPSRPMNLRPLDLSKFTLSTSSSNNSNNGNVHASMSFILSLIPTSHSTEEKTWHFRCDTATEFNEWVDIFSKSMSSE